MSTEIPKRTRTAYQLFVSDRFATYKAKHPNETPMMVEQMKEAGLAWKECTDAQKKKWDKGVEKDKKRYEKDVKAFGGEEAVREANAEKKAAKDAKKGKKTGKKVKDPNAPKRPCSAYIFFCNAKRANTQKDNPDTKMTDLSKIMGAMWKELSEKERTPFDKQAAEDRDRYQQELADYDGAAGADDEE